MFTSFEWFRDAYKCKSTFNTEQSIINIALKDAVRILVGVFKHLRAVCGFQIVFKVWWLLDIIFRGHLAASFSDSVENSDLTCPAETTNLKTYSPSPLRERLQQLQSEALSEFEDSLR